MFAVPFLEVIPRTTNSSFRLGEFSCSRRTRERKTPVFSQASPSDLGLQTTQQLTKNSRLGTLPFISFHVATWTRPCSSVLGASQRGGGTLNRTPQGAGIPSGRSPLQVKRPRQSQILIGFETSGHPLVARTSSSRKSLSEISDSKRSRKSPPTSVCSSSLRKVQARAQTPQSGREEMEALDAKRCRTAASSSALYVPSFPQAHTTMGTVRNNSLPSHGPSMSQMFASQNCDENGLRRLPRAPLRSRAEYQLN